MSIIEFTDDEIQKKVNQIAKSISEISQLIKDEKEKEAIRKLSSLRKSISDDVEKMFTNRAKARVNKDIYFKQYSDFIRSISFESGKISHSNYVTNYQAIRAAARESGPMIRKAFNYQK